jgi:zinc protease
MKRLTLLLIMCASLVGAQELRITVPYTRYTLPNGLDVILHVDRSIPRVSVNMWYHVGSGNEKPGRTGFAHLFEHLMFMGSKNVATGKFDEWLEAAGADNNGSTNSDRTNYFEDLPSNALELAFFLDSDRMGYLAEAMSPKTVDAQRDIVKNERRQSYENRPYGMASLVIDEHLYPPTHPYHWPTIGSMADLSAASFEDVVEFFKTYYAPNNASLSIAGDIDVEKTKALVTKWFGEIPRGRPTPLIDPLPVYLTKEQRLAFEDRVQLPRLYISWLSPSLYAPGDATLDLLASILTGGKNSRLYKRLVYELQIAQDVSAYQQSSKHSSSFKIVATARAGHTLTEVEKVIQEELDKIKIEFPSKRELDRAVNQYEAGFINGLERVGGKADLLNAYFTATGDPDYFNEDLARYRAIDPDDVSAAARTYLRDDGRVVLSVFPKGKKELAAPGTLISVEGK